MVSFFFAFFFGKRKGEGRSPYSTSYFPWEPVLSIEKEVKNKKQKNKKKHVSSTREFSLVCLCAVRNFTVISWNPFEKLDCTSFVIQCWSNLTWSRLFKMMLDNKRVLCLYFRHVWNHLVKNLKITSSSKRFRKQNGRREDHQCLVRILVKPCTINI